MQIPHLSDLFTSPYLLPLRCLGCGVPNWKPLCRFCDDHTQALEAPIQLPLAIGSIFTPWLGNPIGYQVFKQWKATGSSRLERKLFVLKPTLVETLKKETFTAVVPIPQNPKRSWHRGFESSKRVAQFFSKQLQIPVLDLLVLRDPNETAKQALRDRISREFAVNPFVLNQDILYPDGIKTAQLQNALIVDDLMTTGVTLMNAKEALRPLIEHSSKLQAAALMYKPQHFEARRFELRDSDWKRRLA